MGLFGSTVAGSGVQVESVNLVAGGDSVGRPAAVGTFSDAPAALGWTNGAALVSGSLNALKKADDPGYINPRSDDLTESIAIDADYLAANNGELNGTGTPARDVVRVQMQVRPAGTQLQFSYVFASEEIGSPAPFDDGALILVDTASSSGPADKNCASLPGDDGPLFVNNVDTTAPYFLSDTGTVSTFDGRTSVLTCTASVVPGELATVRFVVFDRGDGTFDSGLVLGPDTMVSDSVPTAALSREPSSGMAPLDVDFSTAGSSDPEGPIASWEIDFGDGTSDGSTGPPPAQISHQYGEGCSCTATLRVTDSAGQEDSEVAGVLVEPNNQFVFTGKSSSRRGVGTLTVEFPGPGSADVKAVADLPNSVTLLNDTFPVAEAGPMDFKIKATGAAKRVLKKKGKLNVDVTVDFTPTDGNVRTETTEMKLKRG